MTAKRGKRRSPQAWRPCSTPVGCSMSHAQKLKGQQGRAVIPASPPLSITRRPGKLIAKTALSHCRFNLDLRPQAAYCSRRPFPDGHPAAATAMSGRPSQNCHLARSERVSDRFGGITDGKQESQFHLAVDGARMRGKDRLRRQLAKKLCSSARDSWAVLNPVGRGDTLLGRTAPTPTLWIYSENDSYFEPQLSKQMFEAREGPERGRASVQRRCALQLLRAPRSERAIGPGLEIGP
jgi:hypothetical protein